jgi:hypothetical protein
MTDVHASNDAAVRERAYLLWEQEGRPAGRDMEFWTRAQVAVTGSDQLKHLTKPAPKRTKAAGKMESAASALEATPVKSAKADGKAKPKKK